ncbi:MAG: Major facilitator superfamily [Candidatus Falkowbacteria bacterium GW2011_GWC2_38_22]|uniref:Major facilitator superfamily n=1 Tax=Candidatus Falkowbacteria bacterium GW2011_GWE1_38_31 TaxID=1618638 RepID=A0A0G0K707_9BACT|nr:MAG: Major facilitator superfamily [Candidatus Falkowbacteria bacterium GW2011_GWF2_38_1205]KKQ61826.1 MAG: Major facilitator superfamily [Candidatus Falkowbacteria bacterium GW2011_GWC2_38_22]KKQ64134.1 MAG: Major facilitator superfamily [Candidatus Falkowbacteria bacterium GW2011_GWF1_38_22]KKQ66516.1 MAG: Major facilitator superfamily [Candidatus Falkowbacteria bacterium GW2011_GWE2_38_254]KKQ71240.1 MAG: Major facilitator superfamily [Candidatus Falkowbacteria bacterium GW2011_GWE1_38_31
MRKNIFLWALYDFANSFIYITFFLYFSQWVVVDKNISDIWFNLCFVASSILLFLTAPFVGIKLDERWKNISGLRTTTLAIIFFYIFTAYFAQNNSVILALIFFTIGQYFFALSFSFYTPLINTFSSSENRGRISGIGFVGNFIGNIAGLLLAMPFAIGKINLFGGLSRVETIIPAIVAFFIFSMPMLIFFQEPQHKALDLCPKKFHIRKATSIFQDHNILMFMISFILFNGAILTVINNSPIILEKVWSIGDNIKTYAVMMVIITSVMGSFIFGRLADRFGGRITLISILISWIILLPVMAIMFSLYYFVFLVIVGGLLIGGALTVSRAVMANLVTDKNQNLGFSYFNIIERASVIIGSLIWGAISSGLFNLDSMRYQLALAMMVIIILAGLTFLLKMKNTENS